MRFTSLGSGSQGNGLVVEAGATRVLLDCGFTLSDLIARLARRGLAPGDLDAIVVTHEHDDHAGGVAQLAEKYRLPVYLTHGTRLALERSRSAPPGATVIDSHRAVAIGEVEVQPFPVPHDAREPAQFVFGDGGVRLGVLTDVGTPTAHIESMLSGVDALVLECNYDAGMLANGAYPPWLKRRIAGRLGHLDNDAAAGLLAKLDRSRLQHVVAAHLSQQNNTAQLARSALAGALDCTPEWIRVATQDDGFDWLGIPPH